MKYLGLLLLIPLFCLTVQSLFLQKSRVPAAKSKYNPLQPGKNNQRRVPDYILQLYRENIKYGRNLNLYCIFPTKIVKTKRAIKLIFKNNSFKEDESWKWKKDELRLFMATTKKSIMSSKKPYYVKVFDLHNRSMVNTFKFSSSYHGWKTLNISNWRTMKPLQDSRGKFGLKIVVFHNRRKLNINKTPFRKLRNNYNPYLIEFFEGKSQDGTIKSTLKSSLKIDEQTEGNALPRLTKPASIKRDYYLPFQRYLTGRSL